MKGLWINCGQEKVFKKKIIILKALESFHPDTDILWKSFAPESILRKLGNTHLADAIRTWYIYSRLSQMAARGPNPARRSYLFGFLSTPIYTEIHKTMVIIWPPDIYF